MNNKTTPKDFFLHLGATVALYVAAGALINLSFSVINYYFPDALAGYFYANSVAWPISMLVVLVPILFMLEWFIGRDIARMPEKADLGIRRWRIYLTLFLAVVLFGGDLIVLINTYLNGEITLRFVYKIIIILFVAGSIGKYYFFSLHPDFKWAKVARRSNAWFGIIFVLVAIVMGFIAVGSPSTQRSLRFDSQRINDLSNIQYQVVNYWQAKQKLPAALTDLNDSISGFIVPADPDTKAAYEYDVKAVASVKGIPSGLTFELCATFNLASQDTSGRGAYGLGGGMTVPISYPAPVGAVNDSWAHTAGHVCFERTIDPQKYPQLNKPLPQ